MSGINWYQGPNVQPLFHPKTKPFHHQQLTEKIVIVHRCGYRLLYFSFMAQIVKTFHILTATATSIDTQMRTLIVIVEDIVVKCGVERAQIEPVRHYENRSPKLEISDC